MAAFKPMSILLLLSLLGCNSQTTENEQAQGNIPAVQNLHAFNGISAITLNQSEHVDLSRFIIKNTSENVTITHIDNLSSSHCPDIAPANLGFEIYTDTLGRCDYRYHVINDAGEKDSAFYSVVTSEQDIPTVKTINKTLMSDKNAQTIVIDLAAEIPELKDLYEISSTQDEFSPILASAEAELIYNINTSGLTITIDKFAPAYESANIGWFYISYSLKKIGENTDEKVGYIFINLTDNNAPVIENLEYRYPTRIKKLNNDGKVTIDLQDLDLVTHVKNNDEIDSCDGENWQLSYVFAPNPKATVSSKAPEDICNKKFTFKASENGYYDVTYTVSDHANGFALGMMQFTVDNTNQTNPWNNITQNNKEYTRPLLRVEAEDYSLENATVENSTPWSAKFIDEKSYAVSLWNHSEAESYCASISKRLPTSNEIIALRSKMTDSNLWPHQFNYLTKNGTIYSNEALVVDDMPANSLKSNKQGYVSCIN